MLCTTCGEGEMIEDGLGAESTMVCVACGFVDTLATANTMVDDHRTNAYNREEMDLENKFHIHFTKRSRRRVLKDYIEEIKTGVTTFAKDNKELVETTIQMFLFVEKQLLTQMKVKRKRHCAAICVHATLKRYGIHTTIRDVCKAMSIPTKGINKHFLKINGIIQSVAPNRNSDEEENLIEFEGVVARILNSLPCFKNKPDLVNTALKLLELKDSMWLTDGKRSNTVACIVGYIAFIAEEKRSKKKTTVCRFCQLNNLSQSYGAIKLGITDFQGRLAVLANRLPWLNGKMVKDSDVHLYVHDIVRYKASLAGRGEPSDPLTICEPALVIPKIERDVVEMNVPTSLDINNSESLHTVVLSKSKRVIVKKQEPSPRVKRNCVHLTLTESEFLASPPSLLRNRILERSKVPEAEIFPEAKIFPEASLSEILTEEDFPESEMKMYLRTPDEIAKVEQIRNLLDKT